MFACDLIVAPLDATFAVTPAKLGVPYNVGGMINHLAPAAEPAAFVHAMATDIARNAPLSIAVMKEQLRFLAGAKPMPPQGFERIQGLRRIVYDSADCAKGIRAFKERRAPVFKGV